jgi:hypothetical protein
VQIAPIGMAPKRKPKSPQATATPPVAEPVRGCGADRAAATAAAPAVVTIPLPIAVPANAVPVLPRAPSSALALSGDDKEGPNSGRDGAVSAAVRAILSPPARATTSAALRVEPPLMLSLVEAVGRPSSAAAADRMRRFERAFDMLWTASASASTAASAAVPPSSADIRVSFRALFAVGWFLNHTPADSADLTIWVVDKIRRRRYAAEPHRNCTHARVQHSDCSV